MEKSTATGTHVTEIVVKKGEPIDRALKRLKEKLNAQGILDEVRRLRAFETPTERARRIAKRKAKPVKIKFSFSLDFSNESPVAACASGQDPETPPQALASSQLVPMLKEGLPFSVLETLQRNLELPWEKFLPMLGLSKATLHRRRASGRLDPAESDRVVRYARLFDQAVEVLESVKNTRLWLNAPQKGLGGAVPLEYAETEVGAREVEDLLGRIEYGVYS